MPNIKLIIEYDGRHFHGWQKQPNLKTVQGELERVLQLVLRQKITNLNSSGRTDTNVHAKGQVVNFHVPEIENLYQLKQAISHLMHGSLAVLDAEIVEDSFHVRRSAICKQYSYKILYRSAPAVLDHGRVWHIHQHLDLEKMQVEARKLIGNHNFAGFRASDCSNLISTKEILESEILIDPPYLIYRVVGRGFLKQMVRNIVGTLVGIASGQLVVSGIEEIIASQDRRKAGVTAPGYGLYLDWVKY